MHILHIFIEINFSGAEIMYANAAPLFQRDGFRMTAVNSGPKPGNFVQEFEKANISIIYRPVPNGRNPFKLVKYFRGIYQYIKREKVDVVHVHRMDMHWPFAFCAFLAGKKTIVTPHNVFKNRTLTWPKAYLERLTSRKIFRTTFQTIGESVHKNELQYYKNPSVRVNNWYNEKRFYPGSEEEKIQFRKQLGLPETGLILISVGSCSAIKNHHDIVRAVALVKQRGYHCFYVHLGCGATEAAEKELAASLGVSEEILFAGNKTNVRDYLVAADVFVMPSKFEGLSIASIEAMACGIPGILYQSPGLVDMINADDNGFLIKHDPAEIANCIVTFIEQPALRKQKGAHAYSFVSTEFNIHHSVPKIAQLYRQGLSS